MPISDPRSVLGVSPTASPAEVRRAFRKLVLELHPDRSGAEETRLLDVVEAYERLTGKVRPRRAPRTERRSDRPSGRRPFHARRPHTSEAWAPPGRFGCGGCNDTFTIEGDCPRCGIPVAEGSSAAPTLPDVDAYISALEAKPPPPAWLGTLEERLPVTTIGTLLGGGAMAFAIHAPIATMMVGYGLVLLCADAVLGRAAS